MVPAFGMARQRQTKANVRCRANMAHIRQSRHLSVAFRSKKESFFKYFLPRSVAERMTFSAVPNSRRLKNTYFAET